jgi:hypothetical protein
MNVASFLRSQTRAEQKYLDKMILKVFRDQ